MTSQYTKEQLFKMDAIDVYKMVLKGDIIEKFPNGFWQKEESKQNAIKCTRYLIENILKYDDELIKVKISQEFFRKNKLGGMINICFNGSPYEIINSVYPNKFKEWELKSVPTGYWKNKDNGIKAVKWLIEEKLKLSDDELRKQLSAKLFIDNGLKGMLLLCFNTSPYEAINSTYPNKFKEWEFKNVGRGYWNNKENGVRATKWLIEEKLNLNDKQLKEQVSINLFKNNGLGGMLAYCFNYSPYEAINSTYPNKFKEWEFKQVSNGYWDNYKNRRKAIKWLVEEKLKLNDEQLKEQLSVKIFKENGLYGMLQNYFNDSPYKAINSVYPDKFKEWEFKFVPKRYWKDKNNGIKATKWLIEEKLKLNDEQLKEQLSVKMFKENGLNGMLLTCFNHSPYEAINATYPNKFKQWEIKAIPQGYWKNKENGIKATKWLIEKKLKLTNLDLEKEILINLFKENGLNGMLKQCFNNNLYEAIRSSYPNKNL